MRKSNSLLSYAREIDDINIVELEDEEVRPLVSGICLDNMNSDTLYNILSLIYHSEDVETVDNISAADNSVSRNRYFCDTTTCFHCGEAGHEIKECSRTSEDVCELCSHAGHIRFYCPSRFCSRCRHFGHQNINCREQRDSNRWRMCRFCSVGKHSIADCPRAWRRYKLKSKGSQHSIYKSCPICLSKTHFIDDCNVDRSQSSIFTSSFLRLIGFSEKR